MRLLISNKTLPTGGFVADKAAILVPFPNFVLPLAWKDHC